MNLTVNFTYTSAGESYSKIIPVKLKKNSFTFAELAKQLQKYSPNPNTTFISSISQDNNTRTDTTEIVLQENIPLEVTLTPLELTNSLSVETFLTVLNKLDEKKLVATARLATKQLSEQISDIYAGFPGVSLFNQSPDRWKLLDTQKHQALIANLAELKFMEQMLGFVNTWIQIENGAKHFYQWIVTFGEHFINFYKQLPNPTPQQNALFALITPDVKQLNLNDVEISAKTIAITFPAIAENIMWTATTLSTRLGNVTKSLSFQYCYNFQGADLSYTPISKDELSRHRVFTRATLSRNNFTKAIFSYAILPYANLSNTHLSHIDFLEANLSNANFAYADLYDALLYKANVSNANFYQANLSKVHLGGANCTNADFSGANLENCVFDKNTNLTNANLANTNIKTIEGLDKLAATVLASTQNATLAALTQEIKHRSNCFTKLLNTYLANINGILFFSLPASMGNTSAFFAPAPTTYGNEFLNAIRDQAGKILSTTKDLSVEEQESLEKLNELVKLPLELQTDIVKLTHRPTA